jgi:deazaflavin-dependent oxidoreductase (nitroreductase family)
MNAVTRRLRRGAMALAVALYRWSGGRIGGTAAGRTPVLLLTVTGRRSGRLRTTPVSWFEDGGAYVVVGSGAGSHGDPQWMRNLRATTTAHVQIRTAQQDVGVRIAEGEERDRLWRDVVARAPAFGTFQAKAGRSLSLAVLTPLGG